MYQKYKWTIIFSCISPFLMILTLLLAGGGHGFRTPILLAFPIFFVLKFQNDNYALLLMLLQFPLYGLFIDLFKKYFKYYEASFFIIIIIHFITLVIAYYRLD